MHSLSGSPHFLLLISSWQRKEKRINFCSDENRPRAETRFGWVKLYFQKKKKKTTWKSVWTEQRPSRAVRSHPTQSSRPLGCRFTLLLLKPNLLSRERCARLSEWQMIHMEGSLGGVNWGRLRFRRSWVMMRNEGMLFPPVFSSTLLFCSSACLLPLRLYPPYNVLTTNSYWNSALSSSPCVEILVMPGDCQ